MGPCKGFVVFEEWRFGSSCSNSVCRREHTSLLERVSGKELSCGAIQETPRSGRVKKQAENTGFPKMSKGWDGETWGCAYHRAPSPRNAA